MKKLITSIIAVAFLICNNAIAFENLQDAIQQIKNLKVENISTGATGLKISIIDPKFAVSNERVTKIATGIVQNSKEVTKEHEKATTYQGEEISKAIYIPETFKISEIQKSVLDTLNNIILLTKKTKYPEIAFFNECTCSGFSREERALFEDKFVNKIKTKNIHYLTFASGELYSDLNVLIKMQHQGKTIQSIHIMDLLYEQLINDIKKTADKGPYSIPIKEIIQETSKQLQNINARLASHESTPIEPWEYYEIFEPFLHVLRITQLVNLFPNTPIYLYSHSDEYLKSCTQIEEEKSNAFFAMDYFSESLKIEKIKSGCLKKNTTIGLRHHGQIFLVGTIEKEGKQLDQVKFEEAYATPRHTIPQKYLEQIKKLKKQGQKPPVPPKTYKIVPQPEDMYKQLENIAITSENETIELKIKDREKIPLKEDQPYKKGRVEKIVETTDKDPLEILHAIWREDPFIFNIPSSTIPDIIKTQNITFANILIKPAIESTLDSQIMEQAKIRYPEIFLLNEKGQAKRSEKTKEITAFENKIVDQIKPEQNIRYLNFHTKALFPDFRILTKLIKKGVNIGSIHFVYTKTECCINPLLKEKEFIPLIQKTIQKPNGSTTLFEKIVAQAGSDLATYIMNHQPYPLEKSKNYIDAITTLLRFMQFTNFITFLAHKEIPIYIHENVNAYILFCKKHPKEKADIAFASDYEIDERDTKNIKQHGTQKNAIIATLQEKEDVYELIE